MDGSRWRWRRSRRAWRCLPALAQADVLTAGNGIYTVGVDNGQFSLNKGRFAAATADGHPLGGNRTLLYGIAAPQQSFVAVRSWTNGNDYLQGPVGNAAPANVYSLSPLMTVTPIGTTGVHATTPVNSPDKLVVDTDTVVHGTTPADSIVEITTRVKNTGNAQLKVGIRYLLDVQVGLDDGPIFQPVGTGADFSINEAAFPAPAFGSWRVQDNGRNAMPPMYDIVGSAAGPVAIGPAPTPPTLIQFDCFQSARNQAFAYTPDPNYDVSTSQSTCGPLGANGDSDVALYWGDQNANAIAIAPGATASVTALLAASPVSGGFSDTTAPTSSFGTPGCTATGVANFQVLDTPGGTGAKAIHTRMDGGPEVVTETAGDGPGVASVTFPEGTHSVEFWGEDRSGNQEAVHHTASVRVDSTRPTVAITSDQGTTHYLRGSTASVTVTARDEGSGLGIDPSTTRERIPTDRTGPQSVSKTARDGCGNLWTTTFDYTVSAAVARDFFTLDSTRECTGRRRLAIRLRTPSGEKITSLAVRFNGRLIRRFSGASLKPTIRLTKVPKSRTKLTLEAKTQGGSTLHVHPHLREVPEAEEAPVALPLVAQRVRTPRMRARASR